MKKYVKKDDGVSPVIAVILMVAITVVLAAVLYVMVSGMMTTTEITPKASLTFTDDPNESGKYFGSFQGSVRNDKIDVTLYDASSGKAEVIMQPVDGDVAQVMDGCSLTYQDANNNQKLDGIDTIIIQNVSTGDKVTIVYRPTGQTIAIATIN